MRAFILSVRAMAPSEQLSSRRWEAQSDSSCCSRRASTRGRAGGGGTNSPQNEACKIGTVGPGGGWIFFVDYNNIFSTFNYLEAAPTLISDGATNIAWCNNTGVSISGAKIAFPGAAAGALGRGSANTLAIVASSVSPGTGSGICTSGAAVDAYNYSTKSGTFTDWYLPSIRELTLMVPTLAQVGFSYSARFWSSTEFDTTNAYRLESDTENKGVSNKGGENSVWAVRSF